MTTRRGFLIGLSTSLIAAPAIVRVSSLMPVRVLPMALTDIELWRLGVKRAAGALEALAARMPVEGWDDEPVMLHADPGYVRGDYGLWAVAS